jgi:class 3 adenylate cyclase
MLRMPAWSPIRYAHNGDVAIAYMTGGGGEVDVLVIPGFVSHLEIAPAFPPAARFWDRMAAFARVIAFDKRGMGLSDRDAGAYTLENLADDALAVLDAAGVQRAVAFGISEGGAAATMLAATHADRVSAMIQYGTYARASRAPDYPEGIPLEVARSFWDHMLEHWGDPVGVDVFAPSLAGDPEARDWWGRLLRSGLSPSGARAVAEMYEHVDVRALLPAVRAPTLVLYRSGDRLVAPAMAQAVARGIPGAREVELAGDDHLYCAGDQDALLDEIERFLTGSLASAPADRVLATVVFTDIVGSTDRAATLGDRRWRELLERHERLADREVGRHRGRVVKSIGDGMLASFDGPARAVRAGIALRDAAQAALDLDLRVGVHTGECEVMGDDLGGIGVHIAARVQASADPGQVLVSNTVKDLVVGSGLRFDDRGEHELKGVPGPWRLYAASGDAER